MDQQSLDPQVFAILLCDSCGREDEESPYALSGLRGCIEVDRFPDSVDLGWVYVAMRGDGGDGVVGLTFYRSWPYGQGFHAEIKRQSPVTARPQKEQVEIVFRLGNFHFAENSEYTLVVYWNGDMVAQRLVQVVMRRIAE